ncbi:hypothetical protein [Marivita sp.]|uniref:hypothetical protein n=1 Tax=Marivita sp. TaxID=2003365 RepID=UPI003F6BC6F0
MTRSAYNWADRIASFAILWSRMGQVWECAWEMMGHVVIAACGIPNQIDDSAGFRLKFTILVGRIPCNFQMFLICFISVWEIMGKSGVPTL